jgi:hypothetical protein
MKKTIKTKSSGKNWSPTFLWHDMDHIENNLSNISLLLWKHVYRTVAYQQQGEEYRYMHTDFSLIWYGSHRKWHIQQYFYCCVYSLPWEHVNWATVAYVFTAAGKCLLSSCPVTGLLPNNNKGIHIQTHIFSGFTSVAFGH